VPPPAREEASEPFLRIAPFGIGHAAVNGQRHESQEYHKANSHEDHDLAAFVSIFNHHHAPSFGW